MVCAATAGILEQVAVLAGGREVTVEHDRCEGTGAGECCFRISWRPPASST
jgi:predicted hydrocarbon binding protein